MKAGRLHLVVGKAVEDTGLGASLLDDTAAVARFVPRPSSFKVEKNKKDGDNTSYHKKNGAKSNTEIS